MGRALAPTEQRYARRGKVDHGERGKLPRPELLQPATKLEKCSDFVLSEKAPKAASMTAPVHPTDERLTQGLAAKDADEQPPKEQEQPNSSIESAADTDAVVDRRASRPLRRRRHERVADVAETGS